MYQNSGLAEIVRNPSKITKRYLDQWFTGKGAFGTALKMLNWPITESNSPLLVFKNGELVVDLNSEEKIMYSKTIFHYVRKGNNFVLQIDPRKLLNPACIWHTLKAIWSQSKLLINYQRTYNLAKTYTETIPSEIPKNKNDLEKKLANEVWPKVIAVDYIGEFTYSVLVNKLEERKKLEIIHKLHSKISSIDWYTKAILAWNNIQDGKISEKDFLKKYGFAANNEYELTEPRYYELLKKPKPNIEKVEIENIKVSNLEELYVGLQYLRSQAKRKSLIWISALRDAVIKKRRP